MITRKCLDSFEKVAQTEGFARKMLNYAVNNPKLALGSLGALLGLSYLGPKVYYMANEAQKKDLQKDNLQLMMQMLKNQTALNKAVVGPPKPPKATYDPVIYN